MTKLLGSISANINGDSRYTDTLEVSGDITTGAVTIQVWSRLPKGGMDGQDTFGSIVMLEKTVSLQSPSSAELLATVRSILNDNTFLFKRYGRPTKRFNWIGAGQGLNRKLVETAIAVQQEAAGYKV